MNTYGQIHSIGLYSLAPFSILAVSTVLLLAKIYKQNGANKTQPSAARSPADTNRQSKFDKMNKTVVAITLLFIAFTLPVACASFFFNTLFASDWGVFIITLLDEVSFTYHAGNLFISYFTNTIFRKELNVMLRLESPVTGASTGLSVPPTKPT
jgi:hypothetical protein